jgi:hypothetical protein
MPKIKKLKKRKKLKKTTNLVAVKPAKKSTLPTKTKTAQSTHTYYSCCAEKTKQGIAKGTKITHLTSHCKNNAAKVLLVKQQTREKEKKKILQN